MKKPSSKIREEIAKLQEQLKQAETREAERIGRIALKAGLGEIEIDEIELQAAFEELAKRFRGGKGAAGGGKKGGEGGSGAATTAPDTPGAAAGCHRRSPPGKSGTRPGADTHGAGTARPCAPGGELPRQPETPCPSRTGGADRACRTGRRTCADAGVDMAGA